MHTLLSCALSLSLSPVILAAFRISLEFEEWVNIPLNKTISDGRDVLGWRKSHSRYFLLPAELTQSSKCVKHICSSNVSSSSERKFSTAGLTVDQVSVDAVSHQMQKFTGNKYC